MKMAPKIAPKSDSLPPTAAQITIVMLKKISSEVGETYCTIITQTTPASAAMRPEIVNTVT